MEGWAFRGAFRPGLPRGCTKDSQGWGLCCDTGVSRSTGLCAEAAGRAGLSGRLRLSLLWIRAEVLSLLQSAGARGGREKGHGFCSVSASREVTSIRFSHVRELQTPPMRCCPLRSVLGFRVWAVQVDSCVFRRNCHSHLLKSFAMDCIAVSRVWMRSGQCNHSPRVPATRGRAGLRAARARAGRGWCCVPQSWVDARLFPLDAVYAAKKNPQQPWGAEESLAACSFRGCTLGPELVQGMHVRTRARSGDAR